MESRYPHVAEIEERMRHSERVSARVPVRQEEKRIATTRDLSPTGVYFFGDNIFAVGEEISFSLEFENPTGTIVVECRGKVVRVEDFDGRKGVAVQTIESRLLRKP